MEPTNNVMTVALLSPYTRIRLVCTQSPFLKFYDDESRVREQRDSGLSHSNSDSDISENEDKFSVDVDFLRSLDPKEWKDQDHYAVLGLKTLRFNATEEDLKRAYRKIVLNHHPDKRKAKGEEIRQDDDYFTCITRAYEILGTPIKRRSYDSVDPEFDDSLPTETEVKKDFFRVMGKQFDLNARWSERKNVPKLGDMTSDRGHVDCFYNFWYNFDSWREYSYLDEEDKERGQDRDERRWIEKQNKAIRAKRKKEEMSRIRSLVDLAYNHDPRIQKFKQEEKERRMAAKRAKQDAIQAQKAEEERLVKEAAMARVKAEEEEQKRIEGIRLEREQQKKALKKERKMLRELAKSNNYYSADDRERVKNMEGVEKICEMMKVMELQEFNRELQAGGEEVFQRVLRETEEKLEEERRAMLTKNTSSTALNTALRMVDKNAMWNPENMQLLIKAVNLFPAGTSQRWEVIANFMNMHSPTAASHKYVARDVLNKAKVLQSGDFSKSVLKAQANENAFESFEKTKKDLKVVDNAEISVKDEAAAAEAKKAEVNGVAAAAEARTWTKEEQALLEQAIKTYPISTPERWDRIAECIPNRTKKECLKRVKELVDRVNAKKEAQQIVK